MNAEKLLYWWKPISVGLFGARCRFTPTCSEYAVESVRRFGVLRGVYLSLARIIRCNPFCSAGVDEVPETYSGNSCCREIRN